MNHTKAFHWFAFIVPGLFLLAWTALVVPPTAIEQGRDALASWRPFGAALLGSAAALATLIVAYILGLLVWGIGYAAGAFYLSPFLISSRSEIRFHSVFRRNRYWEARVRETRERLNRYSLHPYSTRLFGPPQNYAQWRAQLFLGQELLPNGIGPRLHAQWEHIGLVQAMMFVWLLALLTLILEGAGQFLGIWKPPGFVPQVTGFGWPVLIILVAVGATGWTYRFRNDALARDVAAACVVLGYKDAQNASARATL